jgi:hypothetical protein
MYQLRNLEEVIMTSERISRGRQIGTCIWTDFAALAVLLLVALPGPVWCQTTAGSISGTVVDAQSRVIPNANITAVNRDKNSVFTTTTDPQGHFVFPVLLPGHYNVTVEAPGFKKTERLNLELTANTTLALGNITLSVGRVTQTIQVTSNGQQIQTETAQLGESIVGTQVQNIQVNGQSPLFFLSLIPGVVVPPSEFVQDGQQYGSIYVNGSQGNQMHVTTNGASNEDTGANSGWMSPISLDAVQEVNVLTSNYQAQYGRNGGAQISVVSRSGTPQFHGSVFEYYRDQSLNANTWTNNLVGLPVAPYHYNDYGFNIGGPVYIPGKFNTNKNKLFFFWDEEWQDQLVPNGAQDLTVPTVAERQGDFSQAVDQNGNPVLIRNPFSGLPCSQTDSAGCFAGNQIPGSMFYGPGQKLLNLLPMPNAISASHPSYNYVSQISAQHPRREDLVRIDYNLNEKWHLFANILRAADSETNPYGIWGATNIPLYNLYYTIPGYQYVLNMTTTISPTAVNEITADVGHDGQYNGTRYGSSDWTPAATGVNLPTIYPRYADLMPGFQFGGTKIGNSPEFNTSGFPFYNANTTYELTDDFSKSLDQHFLKAGIYYERNWKVQPSGATYDGFYNFGDNPNNPLDSGFGFSNALLGVFNSFTQGSAYVQGWPWYNEVEFYLQDTWKVRPRLTLDYGIRFYYAQPPYDGHGQISNFFPQSWSAAEAPQLLEPELSNGQRVAVDPINGQVYPAIDIGSLAPGSGSLLNGLVALGQNGVNKEVTKSPGLLPSPRFGFAYDLTGHHNIVLRAGGGIFYDRERTDAYMSSLVGNPPDTVQPTINYGLVSSVGPTSQTLLAPPPLNSFPYTTQTPTIYNYSAGIESKLPWSMLMDISYVGSVSNHLLEQYILNPVPFGADFLPQNQDPTLVQLQPGTLLGSNALLPQFLTNYRGFGSILLNDFGASSNYNSLQVSLNRRFAPGLFFGVAYTWSKCMDIEDGDQSEVRWDQYNHTAFYGPCGYNPPQNLAVNYVYHLPNIPTSMGSFDNRVSRAILNGWQLSGFSNFASGLPYSASLNISGVAGQNITGTPSWMPDLLCVGNPRAGTSSSPFNRINAAAFAVPPVGSIGLGCSRNNLWGPGINDWDMSLQKNIPIKERAHLELRVEAFNVFNHTQFSGVNNTLNFSGLTNPQPTNLPYNSAGQLVNINGFGTVNGVYPPRVLQFVAKFVF